MSRKPTSLADVMAKKASTAPEPVKAPAAPAGGGIKILTLRLPDVVHDQLREMAFDARRSQHSLLMEALNLLFTREGKPPIAPVAS